MPSRSRSNSPKYHSKHKKRKHHDYSPENTHKKHSKHHKHKKEKRSHKSRSRSYSPEVKHERVKHEKRDAGYDKYLREGPSKWEDEVPDMHQIKQEHSGHRRHVKHERDRDRGNRHYEDDRRRNNERRRENRRDQPQNPFRNDDSESGQFGSQQNESSEAGPATDKDKPDFGLSGKLTEDTNTFRGVVIKYNEPEEARKPKRKWRLYPFKGEQALPILHIHRQSAYLFSRDRKIADIPVDHPSCSKQHAVLQFRMVGFERDDGSTGRRVRPYVIDIGSANGTFLNGNKIEPQKYYEIMEKDVLKFGFSSRDYVMLHDSSDTTVLNDDISDSD